MPSKSKKKQNRTVGLHSHTLIWLRWIAISGQTAAILIVAFGFNLDFPIKSSLLVIAASAWLNVILSISARDNRRISERNLLAQLVFDLVQLGILVGLTGGLSNPFMVLFAAPVVVAVTALRFRDASALFALTILMIMLLSQFSLPLPLWNGELISIESALYQLGLAAATIITIAFTGTYVWRVSSDRNRMATALAATEAALANEHKLTALGGLAAATAHELGTPLGTIQLVAKELNRHLDSKRADKSYIDAEFVRDDLELILSQAKACRQILGKLSSRGAEKDPFHARLSMSALLEEVCSAQMQTKIELGYNVSRNTTDKATLEPELNRRPETRHAINAFIENAISFAKKKVQVTAQWDEEKITIAICDDGPGFDPAIQERLGDPYVTSRQGGDDRGQGGMGLGFFISKTLIERTGGIIAVSRSEALGGAKVQISWPRTKIEVQ